MTLLPQNNFVKLKTGQTTTIQKTQTRKIDFMSYNDLYNYAMGGASNDFKSKYTDVAFKSGCQEALNVAQLHKSDFMTTTKETILNELHEELQKTAQTSATSEIDSTSKKTSNNNQVLVSNSNIIQNNITYGKIQSNGNSLKQGRINTGINYSVKNNIPRIVNSSNASLNSKIKNTANDNISDIVVDTEKVQQYKNLEKAIKNNSRDDIINALVSYLGSTNSAELNFTVTQRKIKVSNFVDDFLLKLSDVDDAEISTENVLKAWRLYENTLENMKGISNNPEELLKKYDAAGYLADFAIDNPSCNDTDNLISKLVKSIQKNYKGVYSVNNCPFNTEDIQKAIEIIINNATSSGEKISTLDIVNQTTGLLKSIDELSVESIQKSIEEVNKQTAHDVELLENACNYIKEQLISGKPLSLTEFKNDIFTRFKDEYKAEEISNMLMAALCALSYDAGIDENTVKNYVEKLAKNENLEIPEAQKDKILEPKNVNTRSWMGDNDSTDYGILGYYYALGDTSCGIGKLFLAATTVVACIPGGQGLAVGMTVVATSASVAKTTHKYAQASLRGEKVDPSRCYMDVLYDVTTARASIAIGNSKLMPEVTWANLDANLRANSLISGVVAGAKNPLLDAMFPPKTPNQSGQGKDVPRGGSFSGGGTGGVMGTGGSGGAGYIGDNFGMVDHGFQNGEVEIPYIIAYGGGAFVNGKQKGDFIFWSNGSKTFRRF